MANRRTLTMGPCLGHHRDIPTRLDTNVKRGLTWLVQEYANVRQTRFGATQHQHAGVSFQYSKYGYLRFYSGHKAPSCGFGSVLLNFIFCAVIVQCMRYVIYLSPHYRGRLVRTPREASRILLLFSFFFFLEVECHRNII